MSGQLVLITGANGHIGFRVLVFALEAGYHVRAAVRNQEKADRILAASSIKRLNPGKSLTFVFVPDLLQSGAYNEAVRDVDYIIHLPSPITNGITEDKYETSLIQPAMAGTLGILQAAEKSSTIKRIVITSSIVALTPWYDFFEAETKKIFNEHSRTDNPSGPYKSEFEAYASSKVQAFNATLKFMEDVNPAFSIVHVHPTFVVGKDELVTDPEDMTRGTNGAALRQVSWNDVAIAHIKALESKIPSGYTLITQSEGLKGTQWGDAIEIVRRHFPRAVEAGVLPNSGFAPTKHTIVDASETAKLLGLEFKGYEEQVLSVVKHYLELRGVQLA